MAFEEQRRLVLIGNCGFVGGIPIMQLLGDYRKIGMWSKDQKGAMEFEAPEADVTERVRGCVPS